MEIFLSRDGVFPITRDGEGRLLRGLPASGIPVAGTIQGEGKLNGVPSLFIRLAGCNLHCVWTTSEGSVCPCDTAYASFETRGAQAVELVEIFKLIGINRGNITHVVITGGEPFLQRRPLAELCRLLAAAGFHLTVETNGTIFDESVARYVDLFSLSPKLSSSTPPPPYAARHDQIRLNIPVLQDFITYARQYGKDFQLKFVYSREEDIDEIRSILKRLCNWRPDDILLMPMGVSPRELDETTPLALEHCIREGWRFCDRLHIALFGNREGV
ncbi:MAG: 7-carboxy-7-deazaguanine synthase QueE [Marinifilaceae bacterium]|nr:7-carboxy-7-deazaguanine synthase QueE [Marinifilaceae bacterium]